MYGLRRGEFASLLEEQGGLCKICFRVDPAGRNLAVDHDHATNKVRGLLCSSCNIGLGNFRDNPSLLRAAALYLEINGG